MNQTFGPDRADPSNAIFMPRAARSRRLAATGRRGRFCPTPAARNRARDVDVMTASLDERRRGRCRPLIPIVAKQAWPPELAPASLLA
jgi:hypothetical protein